MLGRFGCFAVVIALLFTPEIKAGKAASSLQDPAFKGTVVKAVIVAVVAAPFFIKAYKKYKGWHNSDSVEPKETPKAAKVLRDLHFYEGPLPLRHLSDVKHKGSKHKKVQRERAENQYGNSHFQNPAPVKQESEIEVKLGHPKELIYLMVKVAGLQKFHRQYEIVEEHFDRFLEEAAGIFAANPKKAERKISKSFVRISLDLRQALYKSGIPLTNSEKRKRADKERRNQRIFKWQNQEDEWAPDVGEGDVCENASLEMVDDSSFGASEDGGCSAIDEEILRLILVLDQQLAEREDTISEMYNSDEILDRFWEQSVNSTLSDNFEELLQPVQQSLDEYMATK